MRMEQPDCRIEQELFAIFVRTFRTECNLQALFVWQQCQMTWLNQILYDILSSNTTNRERQRERR